ncbi:hypothetical protein BGX38DRAFT_1270252 [Terfezia claveryi]|nr:hypothetical protein BGX38DRAFT_1270252 [Terfezia claveryi]
MPNGVTPFCTPKSQYPPRADPYFKLKKFIPRNEYKDFAKDSDANVRNVAGVRRCQMPTKDHTFEQYKYELRGRVACQQETLNNIKKEHKRLFPNAGIIDSDDEGYCYIRCLKWPKITSGPQLVKARQVVAVGCRATRLNRLLGVRRMVSKVLLPTATLCWQRAAAYSHRSGMSNAPSDRFSLDSEDYNTHQEDGPDRMAKKPSRVGPRSRSFFTILEQYKELTTRAASHVHYYTLFANPMLNAEEIQQLLSVSWIKAQEDTGQELERVKITNTHTHQRHFRASEITDVIFHKYFASVKMRGNFDETFFDSINEVFICLVTSAMHHCLKSWTTGVYVEPPKTGDFKYDTSIYQPLNIGDTSAFEAELIQELLQAKQVTQLAWQRIPDGMRRLAHAEEDEDHSLDDEHQTSDDEQTENNLDIDE